MRSDAWLYVGLVRIWIDTDIGSDVDDALALAYVLRHPDFELVGVSTVFGDIAVRTRITNELLAIGGRSDVPVLPGLGVPLTPRKRGVMFGHEGIGLFENPNPTLRVAEEADGEDRINALAVAIEDAAPDVLLAIGPLTNLGALVENGVTLPPLAIMGGKFEDVLLPGMSDSISEWNWFCDPVAVQLVLAAEHEHLPLVVPAEVTFRTLLDAGDPGLLAESDQLNQTLARLCDAWLDLQREAFERDKPVIALHDPLTAALLVEPSLCSTVAIRVAVDDRGATSRIEGPPNLTAAVDVDPGVVRDHLMETWLSP